MGFWNFSSNAHENPLIPAMHFNTRYICTTKDWFGGGIDVTPSKKDRMKKENFINIKEYVQSSVKIIIKVQKMVWWIFLFTSGKIRGGEIFFDYKRKFSKDFKFVRDVGTTCKQSFKILLRKKWIKSGLRRKRKHNILKEVDI